MNKKGKSAVIFGLIVALGLVAFMTATIAHTNPQGKQTHPVGIETESCQDAYAGAEEQLQDRGEVNLRLLANIEDKCGFEFDEDCSIEFGEWTQWFDRDNPSGTGDWETLNSLRNENPGEICDNPTQIECQTLDGADYTETGQAVNCDIDTGLICLNSENNGDCEDYKIRVFCEREPVLVCEEEAPQCIEVSPRDVSFGSCTDISFIEETNLPQCCGFDGPQGGISCGADQEWVVGVAAFPTCYISNS